QVQAPGFYEKLGKRTQQLVDGISTSASNHGIDFCAQSVGGMFGLYFRKNIPASFAEVMQCDKEAFNRFFHAMLDEGVYFAPSAFEAGFVSSMHGDNELDKTLSAASKIFKNW
ncbi:MAG: aspartate aminotransferase family protein, partial [Nitrosomonas sp.]|nr:aspartate aminotransferase family protein [Nitrosomonas sp.]